MIKSAAALALAFSASAASAQAPRPDQVEFRALYKELVETNTTLSSGSCTLAAERMAARLKAAGFPESQLTLYADPEHPKEGGLVAIYPGTSTTLKPILGIAHIDVVEAKREDWVRDPFTLIEEGGYFYGRGAIDDKAMASILVDTLIRFQKSGYKPKRTVKVALTCGEETNGAFNGAQWLAANKRDLIDAEFALNEGGGGSTDGKGKVVEQAMQVGSQQDAVRDFMWPIMGIRPNVCRLEGGERGLRAEVGRGDREHGVEPDDHGRRGQRPVEDPGVVPDRPAVGTGGPVAPAPEAVADEDQRQRQPEEPDEVELGALVERPEHQVAQHRQRCGSQHQHRPEGPARPRRPPRDALTGPLGRPEHRHVVRLCP